MKVIKLNSRIIKYRLYDDEFHGWIYYTLDLDRYELSISGETTASYKWVETPQSESFIKLMVRCDKWYLLDKLFKKVFDIEASTKSIKAYIKENYEYEGSDTLKKILKDIDDMECNSQESFVNSVESILNSYYLSFDNYYIWDCCERKFKHWDERAIVLFCEYIKPELRKELEIEVTENE